MSLSMGVAAAVGALFGFSRRIPMPPPQRGAVEPIPTTRGAGADPIPTARPAAAAKCPVRPTHHSPEAHARALLEKLQGCMGPEFMPPGMCVPASQVEALYHAYCGAWGWQPLPWQRVAHIFRLLTTGGQKVHVDATDAEGYVNRTAVHFVPASRLRIGREAIPTRVKNKYPRGTAPWLGSPLYEACIGRNGEITWIYASRPGPRCPRPIRRRFLPGAEAIPTAHSAAMLRRAA